MVREMVVNGQFYPDDPKLLRDMLSSCMPVVKGKINALGAILPHAGYVFSGGVCANTLAHMEPKKTYIILGTNHSGEGETFAVETKDWQTPLGIVSTNKVLTEELIEKSDLMVSDSRAHQFEHSIEVQMPFLQYLSDEIDVVAISVSSAPFSEYQKIAQDISSIINKREDVCIIASSDMDHYQPQDITNKKDKIVIEKILEGNTRSFLDVIREKNIGVCGYSPIAVVMETMNLLEAKKKRLIEHKTSGDILGDFSSVVGYAGIVFYK